MDIFNMKHNLKKRSVRHHRIITYYRTADVWTWPGVTDSVPLEWRYFSYWVWTGETSWQI